MGVHSDAAVRLRDEEKLPSGHGRGAAASAGAYVISATVRLPASYAAGGPPAAPAGGVRLRLRTPARYAGRLAAVTVAGRPWPAFNATAETVDFAPEALTAALLRDLATGGVRATYQ